MNFQSNDKVKIEHIYKSIAGEYVNLPSESKYLVEGNKVTIANFLVGFETFLIKGGELIPSEGTFS